MKPQIWAVEGSLKILNIRAHTAIQNIGNMVDVLLVLFYTKLIQEQSLIIGCRLMMDEMVILIDKTYFLLYFTMTRLSGKLPHITGCCLPFDNSVTPEET